MRRLLIFLFCPGLLLAMPVIAGQQPAGGKAIGDGLRVDFYNGINFERRAHSRIEQQVDYQWAHPVYAQGLEGLEFSARWTGRLRAPMNGTYKLVMKVDDGARLWLGGKLLIDEWYKISGQSITINVKPVTYTAEVTLKRGQFYDLKIEYFNYLGPGVIRLYWESPEHETANFFGLITTRKREKIPQKYLFSTPENSVAETRTAARPTPSITPPAPAKKAAAKALPLPAKPAVAKSPHRRPAPPPVASGNGKDKEAAQEEVFANLEAGKAVVLNEVLFEQSKYVLLPGSYAELDKLVNTLRKSPGLHITIAGHTDDVGDPRLNQALSENRAAVVANYLIRNGIAESRIETRGYGSSRPVAGNQTEAGRGRNRRVEFTVGDGW